MGVEFAPIDTYRIDGIGRRYRREKKYSYETVHMCRTYLHQIKVELQHITNSLSP